MKHLKTLCFKDFDSFSNHMDQVREEGLDTTNIFYSVENQTNHSICFDAEVSCSHPRTALRRLAKAFPESLSWINDFLPDDEQLESSLIPDCDSYAVENIGENLWYVSARVYTC